MPRVLDGGPGLGLSPDHAWLAMVHGDQLTLHSTASRELVASATLPFSGESDVLVTANRLLVFVRLPESTALLVYTLPSLESITTMEMIGRAHPLAIVGDRVFCASETGELPRIVTLAQKTLTAEPIPVREPVQLGAPAPEERLLVASRDQLECWDPLRRRAVFRLNLPLSRPRFAGFSARRRLLWIASASPVGPLEVFRFSDGRLQARAELGRRILGVDGHPESPRLVVAARLEDGPIELVQFDLMVGERYPVKLESAVAAFAVIDGARPVLAVAGVDSPLEFVALPRATPLEEEAPPAKPRKADPKFTSGGGGGVALSDRLAGWRNRMADKPSSTAAPAPAPAPRSPMGPPAAWTSSPISRAPAAPPDSTVEEDRSQPMVFERASGWRAELCAWGEATLASPRDAEAPPLGDDRSTLTVAVERLALGPGATRGLALLYAQWLLGDGALGIPTAALAMVIGAAESEPADTDGPGWTEALARGQLGRAGLMRLERGRARLARVAGRFLDGSAPRARLVAAPPGADGEPLAASAVVSVAPSELTHVAEGLARHLGRDLALIDAGRGHERRRVAAALIEARLHGALPFIAGARDIASWAALLDEDVLLVAVDGECPEPLAHLPRITLD